MNVAQLYEELRRRDIELRVDGAQLRCSAPPGALVPELREQLQQYKNDILEYLTSAQALLAQPAIVPLQPRGTRPPVFAVPGHNGDVFCYRALAQTLGDDQPFFGLQSPGLDGRSAPLASVEELAAYFAPQIRAFCPRGPYVIAGYCAGGTIAFELARQLRQHTATIECLALFGAPHPSQLRPLPQLRYRLERQVARVVDHALALSRLSDAELPGYIARRVHRRKVQGDVERRAAADPMMIRRAAVEQATLAAVRRYDLVHVAERLSLFLPSRSWPYGSRWRQAARHTDVQYGPDDCTGDNMLREPYVQVIGELFSRSMLQRYVEGEARGASAAYQTD